MKLNRNLNMKKLFVISAISTLVILPSFSTSANAVNTASKSFSAGSSTTFVVPNGVSAIDMTLIGGNGAGGSNSESGVGGNGSKVKAKLNVTPGQTIYVHVATNGSGSSGGANGGGNGGSNTTLDSTVVTGGGGGGASDVRIGGDTLNDRVAVAAGGGGGGAAGYFDYNSMILPGGNGSNWNDEGGNNGNYAPASEGMFEPQTPPYGQGGSSASGSTAGYGGYGFEYGAGGSIGLGGNGGNGDSVIGNYCGSSTVSGCGTLGAIAPSSFYSGDGGSGGGGGAGYYGGGGAGSSLPGGSGGGGGAGSSFVSDVLTNTSVTSNEGSQPSVLFEYVGVPSGAYGNSSSDATSSLTSSPGKKITVQGSQFAPNSEVTVELHSTPVVLGKASTNSSGAFVATFTIPKNAALGSHQIVLIGSDGNGNAATSVLALNLTQLPATGISVYSSLMTALTLMLMGFVIVLSRRKFLSI